MSKLPSRVRNYSVNSVALESYLDSLELSVKQDTPSVQSFGSTGPEHVVDQYEWEHKLDGFSDFSSGSNDATLFALLGSSGVATIDQPTGNGAGANDPQYTGTEILASYSISSKVGGPTKFSATLMGNSALARAVA